MTKLWTTLWIIFTIVLITFPLWIVAILLTKRWTKLWKLIKQKVNNIKTLDRMRNELLQQRAKEVKEENHINEEVIMSSIFENKIETEEKDEKKEEEKITTDNTSKNIQEKQRKLLEKISYEANVYKKEWKLEEYEKKLIEWLAIEPENLELNKQLADLYFTIWNHKKALSLLKKIIEEDPDDHNVIRQIWEIYLITWDYETAELLIEKSINLKPNNPKYYISMVEILYNTEKKKRSNSCNGKNSKTKTNKF